MPARAGRPCLHLSLFNELIVLSALCACFYGWGFRAAKSRSFCDKLGKVPRCPPDFSCTYRIVREKLSLPGEETANLRGKNKLGWRAAVKVVELAIFSWRDVYYLVIAPALLILFGAIRMLELAGISDSRF